MQANIFTHTPNFHALSLLYKADSFKVYDLAAQVTHIMQSIQFKPISKQTPLLNKTIKCRIKPLFKLKKK